MTEQNIPLLRAKLTMSARGIRKMTIPLDRSLNLPQSARDDYVSYENRSLKRKRIVLLAPACMTATCTMCPLPNEALDPKRRSISPADIIQQFDSSFDGASLDDYEMITVYNNGNFFADQEIDPVIRQHIFKQVARSRASVLVVESLPQFITPEKISGAKNHLGDKELAVAIGLQSSNDLVRELAVNSTCTRANFEKAVNTLQENNYTPLTFLMIKPPFLTESEAICDTVESISYLDRLGIENPILCPTRIAPNTIGQLLFENGQFKPPWLWSVAEVLKISSRKNPASRPRIVTSELKPEGNLDSVCPRNCDQCTPTFIDAFESYNKTHDTQGLEGMRCDCQSDYQAYVSFEEDGIGKLSIADRVKGFLDERLGEIPLKS